MPLPSTDGAGQDGPVPDVSALVGCEVRRLQLDYQVTLLLVDGPARQERVSATLVMEQAIRLSGAGEEWIVMPGQNDTVAPLCALLHTTITEASVTDEVLTLGFNAGINLTTGPHPEYESWHLFGEGVPSILVGPS